MNNQRHKSQAATNELVQPVKHKKRTKIGQTAHAILDGSFLTREKIIRLIPFILYLMLLVIVHVANSYRAEKTWFEINRIKSQMDELRYHYITSKSNLMSIGKQSEVAERLKETGMREATTPPIKLSVPSKPQQKLKSHE